MTHVIIAVDDSEERAGAQADAVIDLGLDSDDLEATVLHVFTENPEGASVAQVASARVARDRLEEAGYDVELAETSADDPGPEIIDLAEEADADLICVAGRQRSPAGKALFGSTSQQVLLEADCPVLFCSV